MFVHKYGGRKCLILSTFIVGFDHEQGFLSHLYGLSRTPLLS